MFQSKCNFWNDYYLVNERMKSDINYRERNKNNDMIKAINQVTNILKSHTDYELVHYDYNSNGLTKLEIGASTDTMKILF